MDIFLLATQATKLSCNKVPRGFEPRSLDSESRVLTVTPRDQLLTADADPFPATSALARLWDCAFWRERRIPVAKGSEREGGLGCCRGVLLALPRAREKGGASIFVGLPGSLALFVRGGPLPRGICSHAARFPGTPPWQATSRGFLLSYPAFFAARFPGTPICQGPPRANFPVHMRKLSCTYAAMPPGSRESPPHGDLGRQPAAPEKGASISCKLRGSGVSLPRSLAFFATYQVAGNPCRAEFSHAARFPGTPAMAGNLRREMSRGVSGDRSFRSRGFFVSLPCSLILRSLPREPLFVRARRVQTFLYRPAFRGCEPRVWLAACFALLCCRFCWQVPGKPCRAWATRRSHGGRFVAIPDSPRVRSAWTVWPSGLRRWLKAPFRKGVGSNPTAVIFAQM